MAYNDTTLPVGYDQKCSRPSLVALMTDLLDIMPDHNVLEIGTGCGYHAAITRQLASRITTVEIIPQLANASRINLEGYGNIEVVCCDGSRGYPNNSPYDRIYLTPGAKGDIRHLAGQLREDGKILYPDQEAFNLLTYHNGTFRRERFGKARPAQTR